MTKAQRIRREYRQARGGLGLSRNDAVAKVVERTGYRRALVEYTLRDTFLAERGRP